MRPARAAILALLLGSVAAPAPVPKRVEGPRQPTLESFLAGPAAWGLLQQGFMRLFPLNLTEIDGAPKGRFFPGAQTFTRGALGADGHFLDVRCGGAPCADERDMLEERAILVALLRALPREGPEDELFDPLTWAIKPAGRDRVARVRKRFPDLTARLAGLVARILRH